MLGGMSDVPELVYFVLGATVRARAEASFARHAARIAAFCAEAEDPPVGVQLCVIGSEYDDVCRFRDRLRRDPDQLRAYADLKSRWHGEPMDAWRTAKSAFILASLHTEAS
jgi:GrpB-like predicted nucleotidyltransferase (UPF0157 family)